MVGHRSFLGDRLSLQVAVAALEALVAVVGVVVVVVVVVGAAVG